ncbi:hypothetical protein V5N11_002601 [Cardamine amara subsp. amara]|uniref:Uncharacterized protein n=1 Tax=Cardamine amara subsp. amara TaxID=228776 RepID=A0ABD1BGZ4_CARAN
MEYFRWKKDNGCYCHAIVHIIRSGQSINLLFCIPITCGDFSFSLLMVLWSFQWDHFGVRALGLIGYVLTSSFLIRENILAMITINIHASLSYVLTAMGLNIMPSMSLIYMIFGTVQLLLNSGFFVLLLHLLYSIFLTRLGMKSSLRLPAWLDKAI